MSTLHVVDMSPCIYAGSFNTRSFIPGDVINTGDGYRERYIPTGGTSMLFNILAQYMADGHFAFVADRNPTIKKELFAGYKSSRTHPHNVSVGKDVAEFILRDCGFTIYAEDGYEADDLIYSIVLRNRTRYDRIFVHTADRDLYLLVDDKTTILPTSSRAKTVTRSTYEYMCKKNCVTPYNTVVFEKFLDGDASKGIPGLGAATKQELVRTFCTPSFSRHLGNVDMVKLHMQRLYPELVDRLTLIYPMFIQGEFNIPREGTVNRIKAWAYKIGNRKIPGVHADLTKEIRQMLDSALYLE